MTMYYKENHPTYKEDFEKWFSESGWNENGKDDFRLIPFVDSTHTYQDEFVECAYQAFVAGSNT